MRSTWHNNIIFFLFLSCSVVAQPTFHASLDTNRILVGEQTHYHLEASGIEDLKDVLWPAWPDTIKGLELLSTTSDTLFQDGLFKVHQRLLITSFDSGFVLIPPLALILDSVKLESEPLIINVTTVPLDPTQDYYDIKKPIKAPLDILYWLKRFWVAAAIGSLIIALLLWFWLRKRKQKKAETRVIDTRTPSQRAKDHLHELLNERVWQDGRVKEYYDRATDITRTYIEESFGIHAMEMISNELLEAVESKFSREAQVILSRALRQADMVKFAKVSPGPDAHAAIWEDCMQVIKLTEPREEEVQDG